VTLDGVKVTMNGTTLTGNGPFSTAGNVAFGGIDIQRSQMLSQTAFLFTLQNSTVSQNAGCGITLSGGGDDLVNRTTVMGTGNRVCGFGGTTLDGTVMPSAIVAGPTTAAAIGTTFGGPTNTGGKVSATLLNNTVQNNTGVGIYITEAREFDPALGGMDDVTEATVQGNKVTGNLSSVAATGTEPTAGGIYIAQSNITNSGPLTTASIGCETGGGPNAVCTRVRMQTFLGNVVECNGRAQLSFAVPQRASNSATGSPWDIGSDAGLVGVTLADRCMAVAKPNTLAGYSPSVQSLGLAIPGSATSATGQSLINVAAYGVTWNSTTLAAGNDYSASLAVAPLGNDDASMWGACPGAAVTCPVALVP
jgi:hypothetical protein